MAAPRPIRHVVSIRAIIDTTPTKSIYQWNKHMGSEKPYHHSAKLADKNRIYMILSVTEQEFVPGTAWQMTINIAFVCNILY